jgi:hypothetical protein
MRFSTIEGFDPAAAPAFSVDEKIWLKLNGTTFFQGYCTDPVRHTQDGRQWVSYQVHSVWWLFERLPFKQVRQQFDHFDGGDPTMPVYTPKFTSQIYLGEEFLGPGNTNLGRITNGAQISKVLAWMNECWNPTRRGATVGIDATQDVVQEGTIDPQTLIPVNPVSAISCAQVPVSVCRWSPDALFPVLDYSTDPPTLSVRTLGKWNYGTTPPTFVDYTNLPEVTVHVDAEQEKEIELGAVSMRQLAGCIIYYHRTDITAGLISSFVVKDVFPLGISDYLPDTVAHYIELQGERTTVVRALVNTQPIGTLVPLDLNPSTQDAIDEWFIDHDKSLEGPRVDQDTLVVDAATIKIEQMDGTPIDLTVFHSELRGSTSESVTSKLLPKWTGEQVLEAVVKASVSFTHYGDDAQTVVDWDGKREVAVRIKLTTATTRVYSSMSGFTSPEPVPAGIAESVARGAAQLQYAGRLRFKNQPMRTDIKLGVRLKAIGPNRTFAPLMVQAVTYRPHQGEVLVDYGPLAAPDADGLLELARASNTIWSWQMPSGREDGSVSGAGALDFESDAPIENTAHGMGSAASHAVIGEEYDA